MRRSMKLVGTALALTLVAAACDSRPLAPEFSQSTTTPSTTIPAGSEQVSTTFALPPIEERVVGTVQSVVNGDTMAMVIDGTRTNVRLAGVTAPGRDECWGQESADRLISLVEGKELLLIAGNTDADEFGQLLRYAYLETASGTEFVNAIQISEGGAVAVQGTGDQDAALKSLEARAYQSGRGMWGSIVCGDDEAIRADRPVVRVGSIDYDPEGPDENALDEESVTFENEGYGIVDFSGWTLRDESATNRFTFPRGSALAPGDKLTVVTGCNADADATIAWCADAPVWSNGGDTVIVSDSLGNAVIWFTYTADG
ncbi:MAG: lamin tail domain-containing protein [Actinomycetota bacterium]